MIEKRDLDIILNNPIDWEYFKNKTVLITGATGRLGMYLAEALIKADIDWNLSLNVILQARNKEKLNRVFGRDLELPNVHVKVSDINGDIDPDRSVDYIYHTAGPAAPADYKTPVATLWTHVNGTRNVLELAKKYGSKVLYVSTIEVYGEFPKGNDDLIKEDSMGVMKNNNARACYPEAKRLCETMLSCYEEEFAVKTVIVRMSHTFGPGISLDDGRAFAEFISHSLKGEDIVLNSDGSVERTYTYVADAVGAMLLAFSKGEERIYNIANANNLISIRDLAELIASLSPHENVKVRFADEKAKYSYLPFRLNVLDSSKIMALGWRPQVGTKEAFRYTMESFT